MVTMYPNIDYAFIVALIAIPDATWIFGPVVIPLSKKPHPFMRV
jgi:hypothetical protein